MFSRLSVVSEMSSERNSLEMTERSIVVTAEGADEDAVNPEQNLPSETTTLLDQTRQNGTNTENPRAAADGEGQPEPRRNSGIKKRSSLNGKDKTSRQNSKNANANEVFNPPLPPKPSQDTTDSKSLQFEIGSNKEVPKGKVRKNKNDIERFFKAIREHDTEQILKLLDKEHFPVDLVDKKTNTAVHAAIESHGKSSDEATAEVVQILINRQADVNKRNSKTQSPLFLATQKDKTKTAEVLLKNGAKPNLTLAPPTKDKKKETIKEYDVAASFEMTDLLQRNEIPPPSVDQWKVKVFLNAAEKHNLKVIKRGLEQEGVPIDSVDEFKNTALHRALEGKDSSFEEGTLGMISVLLDSVGNERKPEFIDHKNLRGRTAVFIASQKNKIKSVKLLLDKGADRNVRDKYGASLIDVAATLEIQDLINSGDEDIETWRSSEDQRGSRKERGKEDFLLRVCQRHDVKGVQNILKTDLPKEALRKGIYKATVGKREDNSTEDTAVEIIKLLLDRQVDVEWKDRSGRTAVIKALESKRIKILKLLLDHGAEVGGMDKSGLTPLFLAMDFNEEAVKLILDKKPDLANMADSTGRTPLVWSLNKELYHISGLLLERGADPNVVDKKNGYSPLMLAIENIDDEEESTLIICEKLLKAKANPNYRTKDGKTPLVLASLKFKSSTGGLLLQNEAELKKLFHYPPFVERAENLKLNSFIKELEDAIETPDKKVFSLEASNKLQRGLSSVWEVLFQDSELVKKEFRRAVKEEDEEALDILLTKDKIPANVAFAVFGSETPVQLEKHRVKTKEKSLLQILADRGEISSKQREDFISILMKIAQDMKDKDEGEQRVWVMEELKRGMETSSNLISWTQSVDRRFPISCMKMVGLFLVSLIAYLFILVSYGFDVYTDVRINSCFWNYTEIAQGCPATDYPKESKEKLFYITLFHIIFPWALFLLASSIQTSENIEGSALRLSEFLMSVALSLLKGLTYPLMTKTKRFYHNLKWICFRRHTPEIKGRDSPKKKLQTKEKFKGKESEQKNEDAKANANVTKKGGPEIEDARTIKERQEKWNRKEALAAIIEVTAEASFQFYIQMLLELPDLWATIGSLFNQLVQESTSTIPWERISILSSLVMTIRSFFRIKRLTKKGAFSMKSAIILLTSTLLSTIARIIFVGLFLYNGTKQISPTWAVVLYYGHAGIMLVFNFVLNTSRPSFDKKYLLGLILNSLSSVYCYNHYDYAALWEDQETRHQPSFFRQGLFYCIIFLENLFLTLLVIFYAGSPLDNVPLSGLVWAWGFQIIAWMFMALYYLIHPLRFGFKTEVNPLTVDSIWRLDSGVHFWRQLYPWPQAGKVFSGNRFLMNNVLSS